MLNSNELWINTLSKHENGIKQNKKKLSSIYMLFLVHAFAQNQLANKPLPNKRTREIERKKNAIQNRIDKHWTVVLAFFPDIKKSEYWKKSERKNDVFFPFVRFVLNLITQKSDVNEQTLRAES